LCLVLHRDQDFPATFYKVRQFFRRQLARQVNSRASACVVSTAFAFKASRRERAIAFASRKSRMTAPLHRRTDKIGACVADPFANGEGAEEIDTFTIPDGGRRRVYRPCSQ